MAFEFLKNGYIDPNFDIQARGPSKWLLNYNKLIE